MQVQKENPKTYWEKLRAHTPSKHHRELYTLVLSSIRGSDQIEGIYRTDCSYGVKDVTKLPRTPRHER